MNKSIGITVCLVVFMLGYQAEAARPFVTDDAGIVETGQFELECGVDFWSEQVLIASGFKHGLSERMDLGIGFNYTLKPEAEEGFSPAEIGLKFAVLPDFLAFSFSGDLGSTEYALSVISTYSFGVVVINANLGYEAVGITGQSGFLVYSFGLIAGIDKCCVGADLSGDENGLNFWLLGGNYQITDGMNLDCGISGGFEAGSGNSITTGIHYEF